MHKSIKKSPAKCTTEYYLNHALKKQSQKSVIKMQPRDNKFFKTVMHKILKLQKQPSVSLRGFRYELEAPDLLFRRPFELGCVDIVFATDEYLK